MPALCLGTGVDLLETLFLGKLVGFTLSALSSDQCKDGWVAYGNFCVTLVSETDKAKAIDLA